MEAMEEWDCTQRISLPSDEDDIVATNEKKQVGTLEIDGKRHPIFTGENLIGRDHNACSIVIDKQSVSSRHALIDAVNESDHLLCDLASSNGTRLGKMALISNVRYHLCDGANILFADVSANYHTISTSPKDGELVPETPYITDNRSVNQLSTMKTVMESPSSDTSFVEQSQQVQVKQANTNGVAAASSINPPVCKDPQASIDRSLLDGDDDMFAEISYQDISKQSGSDDSFFRAPAQKSHHGSSLESPVVDTKPVANAPIPTTEASRFPPEMATECDDESQADRESPSLLAASEQELAELVENPSTRTLDEDALLRNKYFGSVVKVLEHEFDSDEDADEDSNPLSNVIGRRPNETSKSETEKAISQESDGDETDLEDSFDFPSKDVLKKTENMASNLEKFTGANIELDISLPAEKKPPSSGEETDPGDICNAKTQKFIRAKSQLPESTGPSDINTAETQFESNAVVLVDSGDETDPEDIYDAKTQKFVREEPKLSESTGPSDINTAETQFESKAVVLVDSGEETDPEDIYDAKTQKFVREEPKLSESTGPSDINTAETQFESKAVVLVDSGDETDPEDIYDAKTQKFVREEPKLPESTDPSDINTAETQFESKAVVLVDSGDETDPEDIYDAKTQKFVREEPKLSESTGPSDDINTAETQFESKAVILVDSGDETDPEDIYSAKTQKFVREEPKLPESTDPSDIHTDETLINSKILGSVDSGDETDTDNVCNAKTQNVQAAKHESNKSLCKSPSQMGEINIHSAITPANSKLIVNKKSGSDVGLHGENIFSVPTQICTTLKLSKSNEASDGSGVHNAKSPASRSVHSLGNKFPVVTNSEDIVKSRLTEPLKKRPCLSLSRTKTANSRADIHNAETQVNVVKEFNGANSTMPSDEECLEAEIIPTDIHYAETQVSFLKEFNGATSTQPSNEEYLEAEIIPTDIHYAETQVSVVNELNGATSTKPSNEECLEAEIIPADVHNAETQLEGSIRAEHEPSIHDAETQLEGIVRAEHEPSIYDAETQLPISSEKPASCVAKTAQLDSKSAISTDREASTERKTRVAGKESVSFESTRDSDDETNPEEIFKTMQACTSKLNQGRAETFFTVTNRVDRRDDVRKSRSVDTESGDETDRLAVVSDLGGRSSRVAPGRRVTAKDILNADLIVDTDIFTADTQRPDSKAVEGGTASPATTSDADSMRVNLSLTSVEAADATPRPVEAHPDGEARLDTSDLDDRYSTKSTQPCDDNFSEYNKMVANMQRCESGSIVGGEDETDVCKREARQETDKRDADTSLASETIELSDSDDDIKLPSTQHFMSVLAMAQSSHTQELSQDLLSQDFFSQDTQENGRPQRVSARQTLRSKLDPGEASTTEKPGSSNVRDAMPIIGTRTRNRNSAKRIKEVEEIFNVETSKTADEKESNSEESTQKSTLGPERKVDAPVKTNRITLKKGNSLESEKRAEIVGEPSIPNESLTNMETSGKTVTEVEDRKEIKATKRKRTVAASKIKVCEEAESKVADDTSDGGTASSSGRLSRLRKPSWKVREGFSDSGSHLTIKLAKITSKGNASRISSPANVAEVGNKNKTTRAEKGAPSKLEPPDNVEVEKAQPDTNTRGKTGSSDASSPPPNPKQRIKRRGNDSSQELVAERFSQSEGNIDNTPEEDIPVSQQLATEAPSPSRQKRGNVSKDREILLPVLVDTKRVAEEKKGTVAVENSSQESVSGSPTRGRRKGSKLPKKTEAPEPSIVAETKVRGKQESIASPTRGTRSKKGDRSEDKEICVPEATTVTTGGRVEVSGQELLPKTVSAKRGSQMVDNGPLGESPSLAASVETKKREMRDTRAAEDDRTAAANSPAKRGGKSGGKLQQTPSEAARDETKKRGRSDTSVSEDDHTAAVISPAKRGGKSGGKLEQSPNVAVRGETKKRGQLDTSSSEDDRTGAVNSPAKRGGKSGGKLQQTPSEAARDETKKRGRLDTSVSEDDRMAVVISPAKRGGKSGGKLVQSPNVAVRGETKKQGSLDTSSSEDDRTPAVISPAKRGGKSGGKLQQSPNVAVRGTTKKKGQLDTSSSEDDRTAVVISPAKRGGKSGGKLQQSPNVAVRGTTKKKGQLDTSSSEDDRTAVVISPAKRGGKSGGKLDQSPNVAVRGETKKRGQLDTSSSEDDRKAAVISPAKRGGKSGGKLDQSPNVAVRGETKKRGQLDISSSEDDRKAAVINPVKRGGKRGVLEQNPTVAAHVETKKRRMLDSGASEDGRSVAKRDGKRGAKVEQTPAVAAREETTSASEDDRSVAKRGAKRGAKVEQAPAIAAREETTSASEDDRSVAKRGAKRGAKVEQTPAMAAREETTSASEDDRSVAKRVAKRGAKVEQTHAMAAREETTSASEDDRSVAKRGAKRGAKVEQTSAVAAREETTSASEDDRSVAKRGAKRGAKVEQTPAVVAREETTSASEDDRSVAKRGGKRGAKVEQTPTVAAREETTSASEDDRSVAKRGGKRGAKVEQTPAVAAHEETTSASEDDRSVAKRGRKRGAKVEPTPTKAAHEETKKRGRLVDTSASEAERTATVSSPAKRGGKRGMLEQNPTIAAREESKKSRMSDSGASEDDHTAVKRGGKRGTKVEQIPTVAVHEETTSTSVDDRSVAKRGGKRGGTLKEESSTVTVVKRGTRNRTDTASSEDISEASVTAVDTRGRGKNLIAAVQGRVDAREEVAERSPEKTTRGRKGVRKNDGFATPSEVMDSQGSRRKGKKTVESDVGSTGSSAALDTTVEYDKPSPRTNASSLGQRRGRKEEAVQESNESGGATTKRGRPRKVEPKTDETNKRTEECVIPAKKGKAGSQGSVVSKRKVSGSPRTAGRDSSLLRNGRLQPCVLFTSCADSMQALAVNRLGGSVADSPQSCTVFVTDRIRRTCKLLACVGKGIPVVSSSWLTVSTKRGAFQDPWDFLVADAESEKKFGFKLSAALQKAKTSLLLTGYSVFATANVKPPPAEMKGIVEGCGGSWLTRAPARWPQQHFVVSCEEDRASWPRLHKPSTIVSAEFLLLGVLQQKLDFKTHLLN